MTWRVEVRWLGRGEWVSIEECEDYDLAEELCWDYRDERHTARVLIGGRR